MTPTRFHLVDEVRAEFGDDLVDLILRSVTLTDGAGDQVVATHRGRWDAAEAAMTPLAAPPGWVDFDRVDRGAVAYWRAGAFPQLIAQTAGSLAYGYGSASLARPLARTGRLTYMAPRRLAETARWSIAATRPGALRPGGAGVQATLRLRLVHALVRAHLRKGEWDDANWGVPISVGDTVATGMIGFFIYPLAGLRDLGVRYSPEELEALTHLWGWVTYLMGAPEEFIPRTYEEAETWARAGMRLDSGGIDESPDLMHALLFHGLVFDRVLPGPAAFLARQASGHLLGACARRWMGDERADELAVPDTPLKHLVPLVRPAMRARDALRLIGDRRLGELELALAERAMAITRAPRHQIGPERVAREPVLHAA